MKNDFAKLLRFMVIADIGSLGDRDAVSICRAAVRGGASIVELRDKSGSARDLLAVASRLIEDLPVPVLVNDRLDVALAAKAAGCHLGREDLPAVEARRIVPERFLLGVSVGTDREMDLMRPANADYWGVGPCYATSTKPDAGAPLGLGRLADLCRAAGSVPCVGIGGITARNAGAVIQAGAVGVAVVSAVVCAQDPEEAARAIGEAVSAAAAALT